MRNVDDLVDIYCEAWTAPAAGDRDALIRSTLTFDATYCDPKSGRLTVEPLLAYISRVIEARPGARVVRTSLVDVHHGLGRFQWHVVLADGSTLPTGTDFIELSPDRRLIQRVIGFFGPLGAMPASS